MPKVPLYKINDRLLLQHLLFKYSHYDLLQIIEKGTPAYSFTIKTLPSCNLCIFKEEDPYTTHITQNGNMYSEHFDCFIKMNSTVYKYVEGDPCSYVAEEDLPYNMIPQLVSEEALGKRTLVDEEKITI